MSKKKGVQSRPRLVKIVRIMLILFILLNVLSFLPLSAEAGHVLVTIDSFDEVTKPAQVRPGFNIPVKFFGNLSVKRFPVGKVQQIDIFLKVDNPGDGWTATVFPPALIMTQGQLCKQFIVTVMPPVQEYHLTRKVINIFGSWRAVPSAGETAISYGEVQSAQVEVIVEQFYRINVYEEPPVRYVWPSETAEYELVIQNMGNGLDQFEVRILNEDGLISQGFSVEVDPTRIDIEARNESKVKIIVDGPHYVLELWRIAGTEIEVEVRSIGAETNAVSYVNTVPRQASFLYYENGPYVSEPVWVLLILLIVVIVFLFYRRRKRYRAWLNRRRSRRRKA